MVADRATGIAWSNIVYDIPLPRAQRKAAKARGAPDTEEKGSASASTSPSALSESGGPPLPLGHRRILDRVSGHVAQGEYVGILGASGSGKTTLLNVLSARLSKKGHLSGVVTYNGERRNQATWKRTVGYVEQEDAMLARLTVGETIGYAAKLRLPNDKFSKEEKRVRAEEVISMLRLEECRDSQVGSQTNRGVSGGERKRTSIGVVSVIFTHSELKSQYQSQSQHSASEDQEIVPQFKDG
jgi:ABC-type transport system involved in cytochrome bd biosynthesis fused ATPase/permease subunit